MSTYYEVFLEANVNNEWKVVSPFVKKIADNTLDLIPVCFGSKSWYGEMYQRFREIGYNLDYCELSKDIKNWYKSQTNYEPRYGENIQAVKCDLIDFYREIPMEQIYEYHGFVHKDIISAYKLKNICEISDYLDAEEYDSLSNQSKVLYEYFEWDDSQGWFSKFKEIYPIVKYLTNQYCELNDIYDQSQIKFRLVCFTL